MQVSSNPAFPLPERFDPSVFRSEQIEDDFSSKLNLNGETIDENGEEYEGEEEEFSFVCMNTDGSPISADDIFQDGQIRPFYPLFDGDLRRRREEELVEEPDGGCASSASSSDAGDTEGTYCPWTKKAVEESNKACRKSNSTGFSKLRRFREIILRSTSDGKDAFVFLHNDHRSRGERGGSVVAAAAVSKAEKSEKVTEGRKNGKKPAPPTSAHERLYVQNRATKEERKRKSYLPYRVGFFTRNVHPY